MLNLYPLEMVSPSALSVAVKDQSPYIHNWLPFAECESCLNSSIWLNSINIAASCFLPSMRPKRFEINPFGVTTDWNLTTWTLLCPLNKSLWNSPDLHIFTKVPSTKPQQFYKGAPESWIVWQYCSRKFGDIQGWFNVANLQLWWSNIWLNTQSGITHNCWTERPNLAIISLNKHGYEYRLRQIRKHSMPATEVPLWHTNRSGILNTS